MHSQLSCIGNVHQWPQCHLQVFNWQRAMDNRQCRPWGSVVKQHVWQTLVVVEVRACTATAHKSHICNCLWYQVGWYELLVGSVNLSMYWGQHQHMQLNVIVINQHDMPFPSSLSKGLYRRMPLPRFPQLLPVDHPSFRSPLSPVPQSPSSRS